MSPEPRSVVEQRAREAIDFLVELSGVEFKCSVAFEDIKHRFARTAMAMANLRDGGMIIIGVAEDDKKRLVVTGIEEAHEQTYIQERVYEFVNSFASPSIEIRIVAIEHLEKRFVVADIPPFDRTPVVCKKDTTAIECSEKLQIRKGDFFVRAGQKVQSTRVTSAEMMADLLDLATARRAAELIRILRESGLTTENVNGHLNIGTGAVVQGPQRVHGVGVVEPPVSIETPTQAEAQVLEEVTQGPYYTVHFRSDNAGIELDLDRLREIAEKDSVRLRGWDFPLYDQKLTHNAVNHIFTTLDYEKHVEVWRLYTTGEFKYFGGSWDVLDGLQSQLRKQFDAQVFLATEEQKKSVAGVLGLIGMIYTITEFHVFAARLAKSLDVTDFRLRVVMHNTDNWALVPGDPAVAWHSFCQAHVNVIGLPIPNSAELLADPLETSRKALQKLFQSFQWSGSEAAIKDWQTKFMKGRFAF
jgi:hypothetical protein